MAQTSLLRPEGLVQSPAFTHVAVVPPARRPPTSVARTPSTAMARSSAATTSPLRRNR